MNAQTSLHSLVRGFAVCIHTIAVGLCHICDIGIFSSDIYEGVRLLSVYTQLSSGVIGLGFDLNSNFVFIFLHK